MTNKLTVAWGIPVDTATLGAQLEAYIISKPGMYVFMQCIQSAQGGTSLARVPLELVEMIAAHVRQPLLERYQKEWDKCIRCCLGSCNPSDHFDPGPLEIMRIRFLEGVEDDSTLPEEEEFEHWLEEDGGSLEEHEAKVGALLSKVGKSDQANDRTFQFAAAMKVCQRQRLLGFTF